jgi:hypothetical protein
MLTEAFAKCLVIVRDEGVEPLSERGTMTEGELSSTSSRIYIFKIKTKNNFSDVMRHLHCFHKSPCSSD